jgi:2-polyprenyl-6-methoxyphenol hydroxylase-like FAD-dependent oxidoreductase
MPQVGIRSVVLEKGAALREEGAAIGLWNNAWKALEALDVADSLRPDYLPLSRCGGLRACGTSAARSCNT